MTTVSQWITTDGQIDRDIRYAVVVVAPRSAASVRYAGLSNTCLAWGRNSIALIGCDATYNARETTIRPVRRLRGTDAAFLGSNSTRNTNSSTNAGWTKTTSAVV